MGVRVADTERAKMLRGELYLASDSELVAARLRARRLWQRFNASDPATASGRAVLIELPGRVGVEARIEAPFYCDYGTQITLGDAVFVSMNCVFLDPAPIVIGAQAQLGPGVQLSPRPIRSPRLPMPQAASSPGQLSSARARGWVAGSSWGRASRSVPIRSSAPGAWSCATCPWSGGRGQPLPHRAASGQQRPRTGLARS